MARGGSLRDRVQHQRASEAADAYGELVKTWATIATRWANVRPMSQREALIAGQTQSRASLVLELRTPLDVRVGDRFVGDGNQIWNVVGVPPGDDRRKTVSVPVIEGAQS